MKVKWTCSYGKLGWWWWWWYY